MRKAGLVTTLFSSVFLLAAPAAFGQVNYGDFLGTGVDFLQVTETTQTADPAVLWGAPALNGAGTGLLFFPPNFTSSCAAGSSDVTASQLKTTIMALGANTIDEIALLESGDVQLVKFPPFGDPSTNATASLGGFVTVIETSSGPIVPVVIPFAGTFVPTGSFNLPVHFGVNVWQGSFLVDVAAVVPNATKAILQVNNNLASNCGAGATSGKIQKKSVGGPTVTLVVNPTPCDLVIDKTCCIPTPPSPGIDICQGKVVRAVFEVVGGGCDATTNDQEGKAKCSGLDPVLDPGDTVNITVLKDADKIRVNGNLGGTTGVPVGSTIEFTHADGQLKASTKFRVSGPGGTQDLTIHTSCSKALRCLDQFGSVQLVELQTTEGGTTVCTEPDADGTQCVPPTSPPFACNAKIASIEFEWTGAACQSPLPNPQGGKAFCAGTVAGAQPVSVIYTGKDPDKITVSPSSGIDIGEKFNLTATGTNELKASTKLLAQDAGGVVQSVEIHTSCSKPINCGDEYGGFKITKIVGTDKAVCDTTPPGPLFQQACQVPLAPPTPHCTSKVMELQLAYIANEFGLGCSVTNPQGGKASCTGVADPGSPVSVTLVTDPAKISATPNAGINEPNATDVDVVSIVKEDPPGTPKELPSDTVFTVSGPNGSQTIKIHTSCSQQLNLGDVYGSFAVVGIDRQSDGFVGLGGQVEYQYTVTNPNASDASNVEVLDDPFGLIVAGETIPAGESKTFFVTKTLFATLTNEAFVSGEVGNAICTQTPDPEELTVTVTLPPQGSFNCSDAKPINQLSMEWAGLQNVRIRAWKGNVGSTLLKDQDNIVPGNVVTVTGLGGSPNDQTWEVFQAGTLTKIGESKFHISCSDPEMNGIEDCGRNQGNGKDNSAGLINSWLLEGMKGNGKTLDCTPDPIVPPGPGFCGLGFELALLLPGLMWLRRRRSLRVS